MELLVLRVRTKARSCYQQMYYIHRKLRHELEPTHALNIRELDKLNEKQLKNE